MGVTGEPAPCDVLYRTSASGAKVCPGKGYEENVDQRTCSNIRIYQGHDLIGALDGIVASAVVEEVSCVFSEV